MINLRSLAGSLFVLAGVVIGAISSHAEPSWLKAAVAQTPSTAPDIDATVLVLLNSSEANIRDDGKVSVHCRKAVKVLKTTGKKDAVLAEGVTSWREVSNLEGWLVRPDGKVTELDKQYVTKVAAPNANGFYDEAQVLTAFFPTIPVGSTVGFEFDVLEKERWSCSYQGMTFQIQQPVLLARYSVQIPHGWQLQSCLTNCDSCKFEQKGDTYSWTAADLAFRPDEPFMPPWPALARRVYVNCYGPSDRGAVSFATWQETSAWASRMLDSSALNDPQVVDFTRKLSATTAPTIEKLHAVADFVRSQVRYVAVEIDLGRFVPRPAATTLAARFGDCKDKTALMRSMLSAIDIPSRAVLASPDHSVSANICSPFQFDHCIVAIPADALGPTPPKFPGGVGRWFFFDPTDPTLPLGRLPVDLYNSRVLVASDTGGELILLPRLSDEDNRRTYRVTAEVTTGGGMTAAVTISDYGNWGAESAYTARNSSDVEEIESLRKRFSSTLGVMFISDYHVDTLGDSTVTSFNIKSDSYVATSGDLHFLKADPVHEDVTAKLRDKPRLAEIDLGRPERIETVITWHMGKHWRIAEGVDSLRDSCRAGMASSGFTFGDSTAIYHSTITYTGEILRPDEYRSARTYLQTLERIRDTKIVLQPSDSGRE